MSAPSPSRGCNGSLRSTRCRSTSCCRATTSTTLDLREGAAGAPPSWPVAGDEGPPVVIDLAGLERLPAEERELIGRYVGMIQVKRNDFTSRRLAIRRDDLRALAFLFETTPAIMRRRLDQLGVSVRA